MDIPSCLIGVLIGVAVSGFAFGLTVFLFPRLFARD
jgi:hypothetical protein